MNFAAVQINETNGALWAANEGPAHPGCPPRLPAGPRQPCSPTRSRWGSVPEDLHVATGADPTELSFDAMIEVIEKLGSEILLDVACRSPHDGRLGRPERSAVNVHDRLPAWR